MLPSARLRGDGEGAAISRLEISLNLLELFPKWK
jgi:hypothetical protein